MRKQLLIIGIIGIIILAGGCREGANSIKSNKTPENFEKQADSILINTLENFPQYPSSEKVEFRVEANGMYTFAEPIEIVLIWTNKSETKEIIMIKDYWEHPVGITALIKDLKTNENLVKHPSRHLLSSDLLMQDLHDYEITLNPNEKKTYKIDLLKIPSFKNVEFYNLKKIPRGKYSAQIDYYLKSATSFEFEVE